MSLSAREDLYFASGVVCVCRKPNFEDYSCEMVFGEAPLALEADEVAQQGCLADCTMRRPGARCYSLMDTH